jgi:Fe/S biogenesis protein NfuA
MSDMTQIITITDAALEKVLEVRAGEPEPATQALWVEISGISGTAFTYDMYFRTATDAGAEDVTELHGDLAVVIPVEGIENLTGASLDFGPAGMVMQNPNSPALKPVGADLPELDRDNPVVVKILTVLEQSVNPAIAAHGGRADLVAIEDDVAYLQLSGGCQGCGMAAATLREGIEVAILEAVPEITRVADVTDHASGSNPYFSSAGH